MENLDVILRYLIILFVFLGFVSLDDIKARRKG